MGTFRKEVRGEVRRAARLVIEKYMASQNRHISKQDLNRAVKAVAASAVPKLITVLNDPDEYLLAADSDQKLNRLTGTATNDRARSTKR